MLTIGLSWIYVTLLCGGIGWLAVHGIMRYVREKKNVLPISIYPFVGLGLISGITAVISLFAPICWQWNLLFIAILFIGSFLLRCEIPELFHSLIFLIKEHHKALFFLSGCALILLLKSSCVVGTYGSGEPVFHSDSGYYHAQSIRWIEEYGVVPGLGNLLAPLAIDYLWFQPSALFGFAAFLPQRLHALTGLVVLWSLVFTTGGAVRLLSRDKELPFSNLYRTLLFIPLLEIGNYIVSDSGDEPAAIMTLVSLGLALIFFELRSSNYRENQGLNASVTLACVVVQLLIFTVAIKLSTLPLLLLVLLFSSSFLVQKQWKAALVIMAICGVILIPKVIRSVFLSGYLIYPFPSVDLFHFDWKMPSSVLISEKAYVETMSRIRFAEPGTLLNGGMAVWFAPWLKKFFIMPLGIAFAVSLASLLAGCLLFRKRVLIALMRFSPLYMTLVAGVTYWFVMAPDVRFAYGFLAAGAIMFSLPLLSMLLEPLSKGFGGIRDKWKVPQFFPIIGSLLFLTGMFLSVPRPMPGDSFGRGILFSNYYPFRFEQVLKMKSSGDFLLTQDPYPAQEMVRLPLGSLEINRPRRGMHCWDAALPATPFLYQRIEKRGVSLQEGFRVCQGPIDGFSGYRLAEEAREMQKQKPSVKSQEKN